MLQNRVNPFGQIIKTQHRGAWMGNRGVIHNAGKEIVRQFKVKAWITCALQFRGRHREIMQPNRWTELFFLDEATAFAAGHRPCFQCRYADHQRFKIYWVKGNPTYGFDMKTAVTEIDDILQRERIAADKTKVSYHESLNLLPDGAFVAYQNNAYLVKAKQLHLWTAAGYQEPIPFPVCDKMEVLTPKSFVNMFAAGYAPQMML